MSNTSARLTSLTLVNSEHPLAASELAQACGASVEWVTQLVELGIVEMPPDADAPERWKFQSIDLQRALETRRLERDFGVELEAAALILDLQQEVRRLKAVLKLHGLEA